MPERTGEGTDFLYPFIDGDERDAGSLLVDLAALGRGQGRRPAPSSGAATLDRTADAVAAAADAMAAAFDGGGRLFTFGNGGSSTDAASLAALFARPPTGRALPARCLVDDTAVLTALGNDVGFDLVFSRQLIAHAAPGDIAVGLSTSGNSRNLLPRLRRGPRPRAASRSGFAGYDGGEMAAVARRAALPRRAVRQRAPHPGDAGRARLRAVGRRCSERLGRTRVGGDRWPHVGDREAAVLDRIEAFRRRRPRLTDDVVTLAHGAGGKASAALVDAVFVDGLRRRRARRRWPTPPR